MKDAGILSVQISRSSCSRIARTARNAIVKIMSSKVKNSYL